MKKAPPKQPWQQLIILAICRFAEPVVLTSVFPYIPEMMEHLGAPKNEVSTWVGFATAAYSICQCVMGIPWGITSDYLGRKPVIIAGFVCTMLSALMFGFSQSLGMAILARAFTGLGNGNVGIMRTMVAEMVPERELQPRAFSIMPLVWTIGSIFGPIFGGALANPVKYHPDIFGDSAFFKKYPFALPNLAGCVFFVFGITIGVLFLKETLASKKDRHDPGLVLGEVLTGPCRGQRRKKATTPNLGSDETTALLGGESSSSSVAGAPVAPKKPESAATRPAWKEVLTPQSCLIIFSYSALALHNIAFDAVLPVFLNRPYQEPEGNPDVNPPFKFVGGFGVSSQRIGLLYTISGIVGMIVQFFIFPPVTRRYGALACLKIPCYFYPFIYLLTPFTVLFKTDSARQVAVFALMLSKLTAVVFSFPCCTILLTNSASSLNVLGSLNGVATSVSAIGRGVGPAVVGWAFTVGVKAGYMLVPWWILAAISVVSAIPIFWIIEGKGFSRDDDEEGEEEEDGDDEIHGIESGKGTGDAKYGSTATAKDPLSKSAAAVSVHETATSSRSVSPHPKRT